jgi:Cu/Ag efflux pump CusA
MRLGDGVTATLAQIPYVREVAQRSGRAEASEDFSGTHNREIDVDLKNLTRSGRQGSG